MSGPQTVHTDPLRPLMCLGLLCPFPRLNPLFSLISPYLYNTIYPRTLLLGYTLSVLLSTYLCKPHVFVTDPTLIPNVSGHPSP